MENKVIDKVQILPFEEIDKCWMLGIAWLSTYDLYSKGLQRTPKDERLLRHWLHLILNTCNEMNLMDVEVTKVLNIMENEVSNKKIPTLTKHNLDQFQPILEASLRAKNPYYYSIFGSAMNASSIRATSFIGFFQHLRPILSKENYEIISDTMKHWDTEWKKECQAKNQESEQNEISNLEDNIHGLLVGSTKVTDLLRTSDRILLALLAGFVILILGMILLFSVLKIFQLITPWLFIDLTFQAKMTQIEDLVTVLKDSLALLGGIGVATAGIGRFFWQVGQEIIGVYTLHLAKQRLIYPTKLLVF